MEWFQDRWIVVRRIAERPWVRLALAIFGLVAAYETIVSQFVPESWARNFPKIHELVAAIADSSRVLNFVHPSRGPLVGRSPTRRIW